MEIVKIKHREFAIIKTLSDNSFVAERKNKQYFVRKFTPGTIDGNELTYSLEKIAMSGAKSPKLFWIDKKLGYIVSAYLEGELATEYLSKNDMTEKLYESLFKSNYLAKMNHIALDYSPDKWMVVDQELYYVGTVMSIYEKKKDLTEGYIRLWFNTKELASFLSKNNVFYDKNRIKDEYSTNKEIVLKVCKYYR